MEDTTERMDPKAITATVVVIEEGKGADDSLLGISILIFSSKGPSSSSSAPPPYPEGSNPVIGCKSRNACTVEVPVVILPNAVC